MKLTKRISRAWNVFTSEAEQTDSNSSGRTTGYWGGYNSAPPYNPIDLTSSSILGPAFNRIAIDASMVSMKHVSVDKQGNYVKDLDSGLNSCLNYRANIDQTGRALIQNAVEVMFDSGVVAIVPTHVIGDPIDSASYDIRKLRACRIVGWYPSTVDVEVYNEHTGLHENVMLPKQIVAIIHNPLYTTINRPNSAIQRLTRKIQLLDHHDESVASGKLDIIIKLPYAVKSATKKVEAETRRKEIQDQLNSATHGIAYIDGNESVTQLNRAATNTLKEQIKDLSAEVLGQIGMTQAILDGTADETQNHNYHNRIIEPVLLAITEGMATTFISTNGRTRGQDVRFFKKPLSMVTPTKLAEVVDKLRRGEVVTSNEIRAEIGFLPSQQPEAEELRNPNIARPIEPGYVEEGGSYEDEEGY